MPDGITLKSIFRLPDFTRKPHFKFIRKRSGPFDGEVTLNQHRIYILPTRTGLLYLVLLVLLLIGSVNYGKSLGYMLTFLLAGFGIVAMFTTWRNLAGISLCAGGSAPVFAGEQARIAVQLKNVEPQKRYSIAITYDGEEFEVVDIAGNGITLIHYQISTEKRGLQRSGHFRLYTEFPTGMFVAWTWIELLARVLVYPKPAAQAESTTSLSKTEGDAGTANVGVEQYTGLRKYQHGDSWRQVSWKATARVDELHTKEFSGGTPQQLWIDWHLIDAPNTEARLQKMTRLAIDTQQSGNHYGLRLPEREIAPGHGTTHFHECLKALALHGY